MKIAKILFLALLIQSITLVGVFARGNNETDSAEMMSEIQSLNSLLAQMQKSLDEVTQASEEPEDQAETQPPLTGEEVRLIVREELERFQPQTQVQPRDTETEEQHESESQETAPLVAEHPARLPARIDEEGRLTSEVIVEYILQKSEAARGNTLSREDIKTLVDLYIEEAKDEGINHDIAIAQMCYATHFLTGIQLLNTYNYAGLNTEQGISVLYGNTHKNMEEGVRAHIQHLKGYTSSEKPEKEIVNRRWYLLEGSGILGTVHTLEEMFATWSPNNSAHYGESIKAILTELYAQ